MTSTQPQVNPKVFSVVWFGQLVSIIGSGLTTFALGVWVFEQTGSALLFALIMLFRTLPGLLISPLAGVLVDRWDRRLVMLLHDIVALLAIVGLLLMVALGQLAFWHIYLATTVLSLLMAFQQPAFLASITLLVPREQYVRANSMLQIALGAEHMLSPVLAGMLLPLIRLEGILVLDVVTFLFSTITLLLVRFPRLAESAEGAASRGALGQEIFHAWRYLAQRHGLMGLMLFLALVNFLFGFFVVLVGPMVLSFTTEQVLGVATSIAGSGMLVSSVILGVWGGPKRLMHGVYGGVLLFGIALMVAGTQASVVLISAGGFLVLFSLPILNGCVQALLQRKVVADMQGRVFATGRILAQTSAPIAYLCAGLLADGVFVPLLVAGGPLADTVGRVIGTGPGRGIGLMFLIIGGLTVGAVLLGYLYAPLRRLEEDLPDAAVPAATDAGPLPDPALANLSVSSVSSGSS
ncbi:MAG: MFS transporter [Chloroflexaceae bacterium]|nr:MFS transporter [Chloroflexaceae bacterium]